MTAESAHFDAPPEDAEPIVHEVRVGDAEDNASRLAQLSTDVADRVNRGAPGTARSRLAMLLGLLRLAQDGAVRAWCTSKAIIDWGVERFTDVEVKRIKARAEAEEKVILAKAQAEKIKAEATKLKAEAETIRAQEAAVAVKTEAGVELRTELLKKLKGAGLDWQAEMDGDKLRIVVTKKSPRKST